MNRILTALRAFFLALFSGEVAARIRRVLDERMLPESNTVAGDRAEKTPPDRLPQPAPRPAPPPPSRSEALTLLSALQREARLVDLVKQPLAGFSDEEIGAAARNVLSDAAGVLDRFFALAPLLTQAEGTTCNVPAAYDPGLYKLSGQVAGSGPFCGELVHHGWKATTVKLPTWTGSTASALVIAPAEVEIQNAG
jgi:hypothetical protein